MAVYVSVVTMYVVTEIEAYSLPHISDCINALQGAKWFSTIDLASGYHQVPLSKDSRQKSAFDTRSGLFE